MSNRSSAACALALALALAVVSGPSAAQKSASTPAATGAKSSAKKTTTVKSKPPRLPASTAALPPERDTIATVLGSGMTRADLGAPPQALLDAAQGDSTKRADLLHAWEGQAFTGFVLGTLLDKWAIEQKIKAEPAEVSAMLAMAHKAAQEPEMKQRGIPVPDTTNASVRKASAGAVARHKLNAALWKKYGGRVVMDPQAGALPFDAYKRFLEAEQKKGAFAIRADWEKRFWSAFTATEGKQFLSEADGAKAIKTPWWSE